MADSGRPADYDLLVIGGGSAGATAAMIAADYGKKVAVVEKSLLGGTCTNVGCISSKSFLHATDLLRSIKIAEFYDFLRLPGGKAKVNFPGIKDHKNRIVQSMREAGEKAFQKSGIEVIKGEAVFKDACTLQVDGKELRAANIIIAAGSVTTVPPIEGLANVPYLTSKEAMDLEKLPASMAIVGGSYIGLEFATFFNTLGVEVTVIDNSPRIAAHEDHEISSSLQRALANTGVNIITGSRMTKVQGDERKVWLTVAGEQGELEISAEKILMATGRKPDLQRLQLEAAGIDYDKEGIKIDDYLETGAEGVYAIGDCLPSLQLEHIAVYEGWLAINNIYGEKMPADYRVVPRVMFSYPEVASVGDTEERARGKSNDVAVYALPYSSIPMAKISGEHEGLIKLVAKVSDGTLLGAHIMGFDAGSLIHLASLAMQFNIAVSEISSSISAYPTYSQGFYQACELLEAALQQQKKAA